MILRLLIALSVALALTAPPPLSAKDRFAAPVEGEILTGWQQADGTRIAALRLSLAPGWKTYWRTPGDAGIPPQFDWSASKNLHTVGINWPAPEVFLTAGMRTIGYSGDVILPIVLTPRQAGAPIELRADLDIGVCSDVCVPHRMSLSVSITDGNRNPTPAIAAALAAQPFSAAEARVTSATCTLSATKDGLEITTALLMPSAGGTEVVIIEPGQPGVWMSETKAHRNGQALVAKGEMMKSDGSAFMLDRSKVRITVLGKKHAVDIRGCDAG